MAFKFLLTLNSAPDANVVLCKPFYNEWRFIGDSSDTVKHEYKQNIKFVFQCVALDRLDFVTFFCSDLMAGNALLLQLAYHRPALLFCKVPTTDSLHRNICLILLVMV